MCREPDHWISMITYRTLTKTQQADLFANCVRNKLLCKTLETCTEEVPVVLTRRWP